MSHLVIGLVCGLLAVAFVLLAYAFYLMASTVGPVVLICGLVFVVVAAATAIIDWWTER